MRTPASQSTHDKMLDRVITHLVDQGCRGIQADHTNRYNQPGKICWVNGGCHIPDITATDTVGKPIIVEVETSDSINNSETLDQWKMFSEHAKQLNGYFIPVVPAGCKALAQMQLTRIGASAATIWEV